MKLDLGTNRSAYVIDNAYSDWEISKILQEIDEFGGLTNKFGETFSDTIFRNDKGTVSNKKFGLLAKARKAVPDISKIVSTVRFSKFSVGGFCKRHTDDQILESKYTVLVYLETPDQGGQTRLYHSSSGSSSGSGKGYTDILALKGRMLIFDQRVPHESIKVKSGEKITMRTDCTGSGTLGVKTTAAPSVIKKKYTRSKSKSARFRRSNKKD